MVDSINKDLKQTKKNNLDLSDGLNILQDFNDLDSLNKSKSVRESLQDKKVEKKNTNVYDDLADLEDLDEFF